MLCYTVDSVDTVDRPTEFTCTHVFIAVLLFVGRTSTMRPPIERSDTLPLFLLGAPST